MTMKITFELIDDAICFYKKEDLTKIEGKLYINFYWQINDATNLFEFFLFNPNNFVETVCTYTLDKLKIILTKTVFTLIGFT